MDLRNLMLLATFIFQAKSTCPEACVCEAQPWSLWFVVNCSSAGLTEIPLRIPRMTEILDLNHNDIRFINKSRLSGLFLLKKVSLDNTSLLRIPKDAFHEARLHLVGLSMRHNNLTSIGKGAFSTLINLKNLDLSFNSLHSVDESELTGLIDLRYLSLRGNKIGYLHSTRSRCINTNNY